MALVWASAIAALFVKWKHETLLIGVGIGLYVFEALSRALPPAYMGFNIPFNTRYGPFFSTLFFAIGVRLSGRERAVTMKPAIALLSGGCAVLVVDLLTGGSRFSFMIIEPFLETTIGIGFALLALAKPSLGADTSLVSWGQYVLGIYVIHPIFIDFCRPYAYYIPGSVRGMAFPVAIFLLSLFTVVVSQKKRVQLRSPVTTSKMPSKAV